VPPVQTEVRPSGSRDLRPLFAPESVAVVGASGNPRKWGNWLGQRALRGEHRRSVHLVNRSGATVLGRLAVASLRDLPDPVDLVVISEALCGNQ